MGFLGFFSNVAKLCRVSHLRSAPLKSVHRKSGLSLVFAVLVPHAQMSSSHKLLLGPVLTGPIHLGMKSSNCNGVDKAPVV